MQRYVPDIIDSIPAKYLSEADFLRVKDSLIQPFGLNSEALSRFKVFITERRRYLFFDNHHIICDRSARKKSTHRTMPSPENGTKTFTGMLISADTLTLILLYGNKAKGCMRHKDYLYTLLAEKMLE